MRTVLVTAAAVGLLAAGLGGCGDDAASDGRPHLVVTTSILGDVVTELVGDAATVDVVMPPGSNPHEFAPSARQAAAMREADVLVANGLGFEAGLDDTIAAAADDGVPLVVAADGVDTMPLGGREGADPDPHFFTDPLRMRDAVEHIAQALAAELPALDTPEQRARTERYVSELDALDAEVRGILAAVPAERRLLVTNHEVFGYFADRYDFEVLGVVIPGGSTLAEPSAADLAELAAAIADAGVPAIFAETSSPARLADALAAEGRDVDVVELYSESLGEPGSDGATYLDMIRTDAQRIAVALG